jgi:RNA polymerase primary sigma factor
VIFSIKIQKDYNFMPSSFKSQSVVRLRCLDRSIIIINKEALSLDSFIEEKGESVFNFPKDKKASPIFERVISSNLSQMLDRVLSDLTPREKKVVKLRFGIGATHDHTLEEIGEEFNLTRERIRQILEVALNKLKKPKRMRKLRDFIELN